MPSYDNILELADPIIDRVNNDLQYLMSKEKEAWLVEQCRKMLIKEGEWKRDYSNIENYEKSGEEYRQLWSKTVGELKFNEEYNPEWEPFFENDTGMARWLYIDLAPGLKARAVLAFPKRKKGPFPLVIAQHGYGSSPAKIFVGKDSVYHTYGMSLLENGYAVLAPANVSFQYRNRLQRLCLLLGSTLAGMEVGSIRRLLDYVVTLPETDKTQIGMWGISLGGMYTMFIAPIDKRIKAAIVCAFFNERFNKMAVSNPFNNSFVDTDAEHIWIPGWFKGGFTDSNLLGLVCPRAVQIQQGKADDIGWRPLQEKEFTELKLHYKKLGIEDRVEYAGHNGGHEILVKEGIRFLKKWL